MTTDETPRDPLEAAIDECYQRGLDAPEAAAFVRAALASPTPDAALDVEVLAEAMRRVDREDGRYPMPVDGYYEGMARDTLREYAAILASRHHE